ncbi:hypothetical protein CGSSp9BS68_04235 [Streptococcus pneumoniae SP9-BS68]|nr:hypothetical protein CGSSp11BS70_00932 [Streptococcus pneumoniae SP11-BS70]EDK74015.1 hypothetical protein CGSSp3BS71_09581 [Streptococcus pneumoniae SP3-BS71]EDK76851.1 hypothetical protein CGSSp6BS73_08624 [Streptococcus pneumoniae SP6-BS73]EDK79612.1 hypothetical protein CGSSp9BS68_04235 [Streptococcus pneumoniae SP9-BS68]
MEDKEFFLAIKIE